ncbi:MAG: hypothetical protein Q9195_001982 [Heterodermia aff. obscurata]
MLRQIKPKTARSARALKAREPLPTENPKTTLLLRGTSCSSLISTLLTDLNALKRPHSVRFTKKNDIHPFADASSLEFFSLKNDASLLLFGNHSKKRPHCLTWVRCFGARVLDMLETYVDPEASRAMAQFKGGKGVPVGCKPLLAFSGAQWESPVPNQYTLAKSLFVDFFRGEEVKEVDVEGLQLLVQFSVGEEKAGEEGKQVVHLRCYRIVTRRSGQRCPRVEVEEVGPRVDMRVGRIREADQGMWKEAMKRAKGGEQKAKKNVDMDSMGDKVGRIHLGRQDLSELQTRKMKGLKRGRGGDEKAEGNGEELEEEDIVDLSDGEEEVEAKRLRIA